MAGPSGPRDNGPKGNAPRSNPATGGTGAAPASATPRSNPATAGTGAAPASATISQPPLWRRLTRIAGAAIAAPLKVLGRLTAGGRGLAAGAAGAVVAVLGSVFRRETVTAIAAVVAAVAGAVGAVLGSIFRRETVTAIAAVVAAVAAVAAWRLTIDSETRRVSGELHSQFNSDEMWRARLTLERYYYLLAGDKTAPADLARQTEDYFKAMVYQKAALPNNRNAERNKFGADRDRQDDFMRQVDQSRQKIKNFYEDVIVFSENGLLTNTFREKVLKTRFYRNAGDFLECFWLPVELGQKAALYQGRKEDNEKRACQVVNWYREKYPVAGRPPASCVPYAQRQPDFCVDPKAEVVAAE